MMKLGLQPTYSKTALTSLPSIGRPAWGRRANLKTKLWGSLDELAWTPAHILQDFPDFSTFQKDLDRGSKPENQAA
jgi:hypothetical protein